MSSGAKPSNVPQANDDEEEDRVVVPLLALEMAVKHCERFLKIKSHQDIDHGTVTRVGRTVTRVGRTVTRVGRTVMRVGRTVTRVGRTITRVSRTVTRVGRTVTRVGRTGTRVGRTVTRVGRTVTRVCVACYARLVTT